ncbi:MAG: hypothetical protein WAO58_08960 [Fimbriimonadaceae bacterium]
MKRTVAYLSFMFVSIGVVAWARMGTMPQDPTSIPFVKRQSSTPGIQENGHINISGTIIGGEHVGGGIGLTGLSATNIGSGILSDERLSSNVARLSAQNVFTGQINKFNAQVGIRDYSPVSALTVSGSALEFAVYTSSSSGYLGILTAGSYGVLGMSSSGYTGLLGRPTEAVLALSPGGDVVVRLATNEAAVVASAGQIPAVKGTSYASYGVLGEATSPVDPNYGVYGATHNLTSGFGVYASGDFGASGTKAFRIDHPSDPLGKYLLHYSTESPTPQNFYVGNVVTDSKGYAWVDLPEYFAEINANFKYQLTVVDGPNSGEDDFVMVKVRRKIVGNRFQIRTSAPNVEVSWRVDADRNDLYVRNRKPKDVVEKEGEERGKYQHPELYGEGPERGMDYQPRERATRPPTAPKRK